MAFKTLHHTIQTTWIKLKPVMPIIIVIIILITSVKQHVINNITNHISQRNTISTNAHVLGSLKHATNNYLSNTHKPHICHTT